MRQVRTIRYREIAASLRARVDDGEFTAGRLLPSEAALSAEYDASRVTIRRALEQLRDEGLLDARQGFGWFVSQEPIRQSLARLATLEDQLEDSGIRAVRRILDFAFVPADDRLRMLLGVDQVLRVRRLNLADGEPFAIVTVWCPASLGEHLSRADVERAPFYELLPVPFGGATQTIAADVANPEDAALLDIPAGSPVLRCERITRTVAGQAVLVSAHVFPGYRTEFVVDMPQSEPSIAPTGLRLVQ
jgi:DNA-binding GntR family transcriptional regulator